MLKVFDAFAGYGGAEFALKKAGIEHECIGFSEIDKFAIRCFQQNHCKKDNLLLGSQYTTVYFPLNYGDITKINWALIPDFDLLTGGFPCQDISQAGKQDLSKGRSALVFELTKALRLKKPKYFLFENVAAIQQEKFKDFLRQAENEMKSAGYQVFRICLNSKDFGIPQSRQRVWFIGFRNDLRKLFGWNPYPTETGCKLKLKDILEPIVDKKYFLSEKAIKFFERHNYRIGKDKDISPTIFNLEHGYNKQTKDLLVSCAIRTRNNKPNLEIGNEQANSISSVQKDSMVCFAGYKKDRLQETPTVSKHFGTGGNNVPLIIDKNDNYDIFGKIYSNNCSAQANRIYKKEAPSNSSSSPTFVYGGNNSIRRLTPKECFRLMGFLNDEINLEGISDSQKCKLAGNGWEINVVSLIFKKMFEQKK